MSNARVTVEKVSPRKWRVFSADGTQSKDFRSKDQALTAAYFYARYTLGNQSMFVHCCVNPIGFEFKR